MAPLKESCIHLKHILLIGISIFSFFIKPIFGQEKNGLDTLVELESVMISSSRFEEPKQESTQFIVAVSKEDIAFQSPQTSADLLGATGQVVVQKSQQGGGSPMIRGFSANRLLISVDGVRMNTAIFRSGNLQNIISIDPFSVENAEVLFGSGSVMYGSDAIGGVMNFQTLNPQFSPDSLVLNYGNAVERYSSANHEKTIHLDYNIGWKKWALVSSVSFFNFGELKMGENGEYDYTNPFVLNSYDGEDIQEVNKNRFIQTPTRYRQLNLLQKVRYKPTEQLELIYSILFSKTSNYSRYDRLLQTVNDVPKYARFDYGPQVWARNNLEIVYTPQESKLYTKMNTYLAHQYFEESRISRRFNSKDQKTRTEKVNAFSLNVDFIKNETKKHTLNYGIESVLNVVKSEGINLDITMNEQSRIGSRYPQSRWLSNALYITDSYEVSKKTRLKAGVRYNHFVLQSSFDTIYYPLPFTEAKTQNNSVTGNVGVVYQSSENLLFTLNLSNAFRSPNVDDVGKVFDSEQGNVVVPNVGLSPEYAYSVDVGTTLKLGASVEFDGAIYYTILKDALVRRDFEFNGVDSIYYDGELSKVQAIQNSASAYVYGFQGGVKVGLPFNMKLVSQLSVQTGEEELADGSQSPLRHVAPLYGITHIQYERDKLKVDFNVAYSGEKEFRNMPQSELEKAYLYAKDENGDSFSPAWFTLNLKAKYAFSKLLKLSIGVDNITDLQYRPYSSGLVAAGRSYIVSIASHF